MKVECIKDANQGPPILRIMGKVYYGDRISFGDIYEVVGTYTSERGSDMLLLAGMKRNDPELGDGWKTDRFKPLNRQEKKTKIKEIELV